MNRAVFLVLITLAFLLPNCSNLPETLSTASPTLVPTGEVFSITGRVVDMDGNPIHGASVASKTASTTSDEEGWFDLPSENIAQWITVKSSGFISRTRAAAPGLPVLFRLTPNDGKTMVIHFAGATMFGRRFFDPNEDNHTADGLIPLQPTWMTT